MVEKTMDMRERIFNGQLFLDNCQNLDQERKQAKKRMKAFNDLDIDDVEAREEVKNAIFGKKNDVFIESPFYFSYGINIEVGQKCYINYNCNFIDDGKIIIGDYVMFGANVTIATVGHPINPNYRKFMYTKPVTIENNCWIGAGVVINPGVTIGENSVIGSGSVVTKSIPANSVAVGNPCRVLREINEQDRLFYQPGMPIIESELNEVEETNTQP